MPCLVGPNVITGAIKSEKGDEPTDEGSERWDVAGFEDGGREPRAKKCRWPLDTRKGQEMACPQEPPEGMTPCF